jgi:hypothetical protein
MPKEITKENLQKYAEEHLEGTANMVASGLLDGKIAKGHVMELFYLSGTFGLGLQDKARHLAAEIEKEILGK